MAVGFGLSPALDLEKPVLSSLDPGLSPAAQVPRGPGSHSEGLSRWPTGSKAPGNADPSPH